MKQIAFVLSFSILFLAFKPGVDSFASTCHDVVSCCADSCDIFAIEDGSNSSDSDRGCNGNSCNPFLSCSSSFILGASELQTDLSGALIPKDVNFNYQFNIKSIVAEKFWHPPKAV